MQTSEPNADSTATQATWSKTKSHIKQCSLSAKVLRFHPVDDRKTT